MDNPSRSDLQTELDRLLRRGVLSPMVAAQVTDALHLYQRVQSDGLAQIETIVDQSVNLAKALKASKLELEMSETLAKSGSYRWSLRTGEDIWSDYIWRLLEHDPSEVTSSFESFAARIHPDERASVVKRLTTSAYAGITFEVEFRLRFPDGRTKYIRSRGRQDGADHYIGVLMDITELRSNEMALQQIDVELAATARQTELGEVAASIAHDLNQPLTAIAANTGATIRWLEREDPEIGRAVDSLKTLGRDARRAAGILTGMQSLTGQAGTDGELLDVDELLEEVAASGQAAVDAHKTLLILDLGAEKAKIRGNSVQIGQVVYNLVLNSLEAMGGTGDGARRVTVSSKRMVDSVEIAVADNGSGMDPQTSEQVFESFFTTKRTGMGLGLAICRSIVQRHGGVIEVESDLGGGSTFRFRLPLIESGE